MNHHDSADWKGVPLAPAPENDGDFPVIERLRQDGDLFTIEDRVLAQLAEHKPWYHRVIELFARLDAWLVAVMYR